MEVKQVVICNKNIFLTGKKNEHEIQVNKVEKISATLIKLIKKYIEGSVLQSNRQEIKALQSQVFVINSPYPTESGYSLSEVRGEEGLAAPTLLALPVSMKSARRSIPEPESNRVS